MLEVYGTRPADGACSGTHGLILELSRAIHPERRYGSVRYCLMTPSTSYPPRWTFAVATLIWAMVVGLAARVAIGVVAPALGGEPLMKWLATSPLGLATGAVLIQCALLAMAQLRSTLMPDLRTSLVKAMRTRPSRSLAAVGLVVGLAPLANLCGMFVAKLTGANLDSIEFVGALVRKSSGFELFVMCTALTLMPAIVEETLFRGLVLGTL